MNISSAPTTTSHIYSGAPPGTDIDDAFITRFPKLKHVPEEYFIDQCPMMAKNYRDFRTRNL